jgi:plasmid stability protein
MSITLTLDAATSAALRSEAAAHKKSPAAFLREMLEDLADYRLVQKRAQEGANLPTVNAEEVYRPCGI